MDLKQFIANENEKPLDSFPLNGGFCTIFRKIGAVGDSLSSGEFEVLKEDGTKEYHDCFDFSWGQFMARICGSQVTNFSRGGMTAKEFCESFADKYGYFDADKACAAYIIALGCNDIFGLKMPIGSINDVNFEDCRSHPDNFAGWYGELVLRYKEISPDAKFFFVTLPREDKSEEEQKRVDDHQKLLYDMAEAFGNSYVIDLRRYAVPYDAGFKEKFFLHGHLNPAGYKLTAEMFVSYIDWIIRNNPKDFEKAGFIKAQYNRTIL